MSWTPERHARLNDGATDPADRQAELLRLARRYPKNRFCLELIRQVANGTPISDRQALILESIELDRPPKRSGNRSRSRSGNKGRRR